MSRHHDARTGQGISLLIFLAAMFFSWWTADASATTSPESRSSAGTVLFIDAAVKNPELLLTGLKPDVSVIRLQHGQDGVQQIAEALKPYQNLDSIQILSHGNPGAVRLGATTLSDANIDRYQSVLRVWGTALKSGGEIQLYGCNVAQGPMGDRFVERIGQMTGVPVAASTDATGPVALGGNWLLERRTAKTSEILAISREAQARYTHLLNGLTITGINPNSGPTAGGTTVIITGSGFTGATDVLIGGAVASFTVDSDTQITASTPAGTPGGADVMVVGALGMDTGIGLFTYVGVAQPTVTGISPNSGSTAGGTAVTITGTDFTGATSVTIGGAAATGVVVVNDTTITATTPAGTAGAQDVAVTTPGGTGTGTGLFTYFGAAAKLQFQQQPTHTVAGASLTPAVTVQIVDANGNLTASTADVTLAIGTNPASGTLGGTLTVAAVNGTATFSNLSIDKAGTGYTLAASSTGLTGATSDAFNVTAITAYTGPLPGGGSATATLSGGGASCGFSRSVFIPVTGDPASPSAAQPAGYNFANGLFDFSLDGCTAGGTVTVTIAYPSALAANTVYWKYGPTRSPSWDPVRDPTPGATPHWYQIPATVSGNTVTFSITDGQLGDDDLTANGTIVDQGGPAAPTANGAVAIPTLGEWGVLLLSGLLAVVGLGMVGRGRRATV